MKVSVDTEKLTRGLEAGVPNTRMVSSDFPRDDILRTMPCGLVTSAISEYLKREEIPHQLVISEPDLWFNPNIRHVFPIVGESADHSVVVDAAYSQFLDFTGINTRNKDQLDADFFPEKKILDFRLQELDDTVDWLALWAEAFRDVEPYFEKLKAGPLSSVSNQAIRVSLNDVWNPNRLSPWNPSQRVVDHGRVVSESIPSGAITISS